MLLAAASDASNGQVFNLGDKEHISLLELATLLVSVHGAGKYELVPFPLDRKVIDIGDYYANFDKIDKMLDWRPKISLRDGLPKTLAYYRANHQHYWD